MTVMIRFKGIKSMGDGISIVFIASDKVSAVSEIDESACCIHTDGGNFGVHVSQEEAIRKLGLPMTDVGPTR